MTRTILIPVEGEAAEVDVDVDDFTDMASAIGADYIEFVRIADPAHRLIVDETGRLTGREVNRRVAYGQYPDVIVGDVLVIGWDETQSYTEDGNELTDATLAPADVVEWALGF